MITVTEHIIDPKSGGVLCARCLREHGVAYEMAICESKKGYACDETETGHFLPEELVGY